MDDRIGQQIGNYRLVELIGEGFLTKVYLGEHIYLHTLAAIKVSEVPFDNPSIFRFQRESEVIARLVHPNIIRVLDFGVEQGSAAFLVVTYAPRGTFPRNYPKGSHLSPIFILPYVKQLCSALQYAHDSGVVHRNIRPKHIFLADNNEVLLDHFDSSWVDLRDPSPKLELELSHIHYQAPEQIQRLPISRRSDQYALGVVIYEWLSGECPFEGKTSLEIAMKHLTETPPSFRKDLNIAPQVEQVVMKALAKDPHQRFPSIQDFSNAFERACMSEQAPLAPSTKNCEMN